MPNKCIDNKNILEVRATISFARLDRQHHLCRDGVRWRVGAREWWLVSRARWLGLWGSGGCYWLMLLARLGIFYIIKQLPLRLSQYILLILLTLQLLNSPRLLRPHIRRLERHLLTQIYTRLRELQQCCNLWKLHIDLTKQLILAIPDVYSTNLLITDVLFGEV